MRTEPLRGKVTPILVYVDHIPTKLTFHSNDSQL